MLKKGFNLKNVISLGKIRDNHKSGGVGVEREMRSARDDKKRKINVKKET